MIVMWVQLLSRNGPGCEVIAKAARDVNGKVRDGTKYLTLPQVT